MADDRHENFVVKFGKHKGKPFKKIPDDYHGYYRQDY